MINQCLLIKRVFIFCCAILMWVSVSANQHANKNLQYQYFHKLESIQALPRGASAITESGYEQIKRALSDLKRHHVLLPYRLNDKKLVTKQWGESVSLFEGNFSNKGKKEYLFVVNSGTANTQIISNVYQVNGEKIISIDFDQIVSSNSSANFEMKDFYWYFAEPFAYVQNNKTYLRFMNLPEKWEYDSKKLAVYTYLWQGHQFKLNSILKDKKSSKILIWNPDINISNSGF